MSTPRTTNDQLVARRVTAIEQVQGSALRRWDTCLATYASTLQGLGITQDTQTIELTLAPRPVGSEAEFVAHLQRYDESWLWFVTRTEPRLGLALPVVGAPAPSQAALGLYLETHSRLSTWFLSYVWRAEELAASTRSLLGSSQVIASAACSRALLETAAQFWADAKAISNAWNGAKLLGPPSLSDALESRHQLQSVLATVQFGAQWKKAPERKSGFGAIKRPTVMDALDQLSAAFPGALRADYEWLCNVVHPSIGTSLVYATPPVRHESGTHSLRLSSNSPARIDGATEPSDFEVIPAVIARTSIAALTAMNAVADALIRVVDDLGLTTEAPSYAPFQYWRALTPGVRNEFCPCRSSKKSKHCIHRWGVPTAPIPESFELATP